MRLVAFARRGSRRWLASRNLKRRWFASRSLKRRGFTLIEVIITIALVSLLAGTIISGTGMLGSNRLRSAAGLMVTVARLAVTRANATGNAVRIVFDMDAQRLSLEETSDRMLRVKDKGDKTSEGTAAGADPASEAEKQALEYADGIIKGPKAPRARYTGIPIGLGGDAEKGRDLGAGLKPRDKGRAYLYFWPGGGTERAVVQLQQKNKDDQVLSIIVSPLTGRAQIKRGKFDYEAPRTEDDFGQREAETP
jgi:general secretion pathway protein H